MEPMQYGPSMTNQSPDYQGVLIIIIIVLYSVEEVYSYEAQLINWSVIMTKGVLVSCTMLYPRYLAS